MSDDQIFDAIVIGGGHNGLTAACYLSKAGLRTLVLERRAVVGGAAVTEQIHPGFRTSTLSYICGLLHPQVIKDLELARHGFELIPLAGVLLICCDGRELLLSSDVTQQQNAVAQYSNSDFAALGEFGRRIGEASAAVRGQWLREPPPLSGLQLAGVLSSIQFGRDLKGTGPEGRQMLVRALMGTGRQLIDRWFSSDMIKLYQSTALAFGNYAGLDEPGSAIPFLRHGVRWVGGKRSVGIVRGGMGVITQAMAAYATQHGCDIRTSAPVSEIVVEAARATGVRLEDGTVIRGKMILANTDPKRTFLGLVGRKHLSEDFAADIEGYRMGSASVKINLALSGLPRFRNDDAGAAPSQRHGALVNLVDSVSAIERSYRTARVGQIGDPGAVQVVIPSVLDPSLAPAGQHVASLACKYFPYELADGLSWDRLRDETADRIIAWVERFIPGLRDLIVARQVITPLDLEREYGLTRGDIFHGRIDPDQIWSLRPHPDAAQYRTPIPGLYLCGSGSHPGGGVTGAPGHNAAKRVLRDFRRRR